MNIQKLLMDEVEERLELILWKIETLLEPDEISLIRWACGKSSYKTKGQHVNFDNEKV